MTSEQKRSGSAQSLASRRRSPRRKICSEPFLKKITSPAPPEVNEENTFPVPRHGAEAGSKELLMMEVEMTGEELLEREVDDERQRML